MNTLSEFSLEVTRWLQQNYPQLRSFFALVSNLGEFEFYLAVVTTILWTINKRFGFTVAYLLAISELTNTTVKQVFRAPRPYWEDASLGLSSDDKYGIPSGHAQGATVFYLFAATWLRRRWIWIAAVLAVVIMSLSRIYLGVHQIPDILAGIALGALILGLYYLWSRFFDGRFRNRILGQRLLIVTIPAVVLAAAFVAVFLLLGEPDYPAGWSGFVATAQRASIDSATTAAAGLLGLGIGYLLENSRVRFVVDGPWWKRLLRLVVGGIGLLLIWRGLGAVFPKEPLALAIPLRFLRYLLLSLWVTYYGPLVFVRLRLADALAEPEHQLKIS